MIIKKKCNKKNKLRKESFIQGIISLIFSQIIIKILGLIYKWYLTNKEGFGDEGNALYSAGFAIYALLLTISSTGVPNAVAKLVSEHIAKGDYRGAHRIFKISLITFSIIGLIGMLIMFFGADYISTYIISISDAKYSLISLSPAIFFVSIISVFRGYFNGRNSMKATANSQTIEQLFKTILTILIVEIITIQTKNTKLMAAGANLATTVATMTSFVYLYIYYKIRRKEIGKEIVKSKNYNIKSIFGTVKKILSVSIPISLSSILTSINRNIDSFTVKRGLQTFMTDVMAIKEYGILSGKVDTLVSLPLSFNMAFATALVPTLTYAKERKEEGVIKEKISFSLLITVIIGFPCMIGMMIFANPILELLFPNATEGAWILQVSSLSIIFTMIEQTVNGALQGIGKVLIPAISLTIGVIFKFILNIILVPIEKIWIFPMGAAGAALSTVICHIIAVTIGLIALNKNIKLNLSFSKFIIKPFLATLIMGICSYGSYVFIKSIGIGKMSIIISIIIAVLVYIFSLLILKVFKKEEILMFPYVKKIGKLLKIF